MRIATFATTLGLAVLGTIALAQSVTYDYDRAANFSSYKTYAWTRGTELTDELNHARVVRGVDSRLVAKGLTRVEPSANPDVLVAYHASFEKNLEIFGSTHGWGPFGLGGRPAGVGEGSGGSGRNACRRHRRRTDRRDRMAQPGQQ